MGAGEVEGRGNGWPKGLKGRFIYSKVCKLSSPIQVMVEFPNAFETQY